MQLFKFKLVSSIDDEDNSISLIEHEHEVQTAVLVGV